MTNSEVGINNIACGFAAPDAGGEGGISVDKKSPLALKETTVDSL